MVFSQTGRSLQLADKSTSCQRKSDHHDYDDDDDNANL
jgi:hypothetical protein